MPERPGKLGKAVQKIDDRLPITFRFYTGAGIPPVGYDEAVFTEDTSQNADGVGKLYFRRRGRIHVIEAGYSYIITQPPGPNPGFFLLDDEYLFWASNSSYTATQRSAGIRWAVAAANPDRFEFDTGHASSNGSTRHYITKFVTGTDANLGVSAFRYVLSDSTTYSLAPSTTVYRGLTLEGSLAVAAAAGSGSGSNLITNGTFSTWSGTDYPNSWWVKGGTSQQTGRDGTGFCVQVNTSSTSPGNTDSTLQARSPGGDDRLGSPLGNCYIQLQKNKLYSWTFYVWMLSVETTRQLGVRIAAYVNAGDSSPAYTLLAGGQGFPGGTSVSFNLTGLPWPATDNQIQLTGWPNDQTWRQVTITFDTTNVGAAVSDPFYADVRFYGDPRDNISFWRFDDVTLALASSNITAPTTIVGIAEDQFQFVPTITGSGDTLALSSLVGINAVPVIAPSIVASGTCTLTSAYGVLAGLGYTAPSGTFTLTDAYSIYAQAPGVGTNKYALWANGTTVVGNGSELRLYKASSTSIYTGFTAGAQGSTIQYTLPTSQGAASTVLLNNGSGALSWSAVSAVAYVQVQEEGVNLTQRGTINFIGAAITAADDAGNSRTNVTLSQSPASASVVGTGRTITATAPIRIDGGASADLSADRTVSVTSAALTRVDDTNVTLTLGGSPSTALLAATSLTLGWTGQLSLTRGGTAASLTAVNGGIVYSTASALAISAAGTSGQVLQSGGAGAPTWSTATFPATAGSSGNILISNGTNWVSNAVSGDITITSGGVTAIGTNKVTNTMIRQSTGLSVIGRSASTAGNVADITGTANQVLRVDSAGTTLGFGAVNLASTSAVTGTLPVGNGGTGQASNWTANAVIRAASTSALASSTILTDDGTSFTASKRVAYSGSTNVTLASGETADLNIGDVAVVRLTGDPAISTLTGITNGASGRIVVLENVGGDPLYLQAPGSSSAANQFHFPGTSVTSYTLGPGQCCVLVYDATLAVWRPVADNKSFPVNVDVGFYAWMNSTGTFLISNSLEDTAATGAGMMDATRMSGTVFEIADDASHVNRIRHYRNDTGQVRALYGINDRDDAFQVFVADNGLAANTDPGSIGFSISLDAAIGSATMAFVGLGQVNGGGADLGATGGAAWADLYMSGKGLLYDGITTEGKGLVPVHDSVGLTNQGADIAATNLTNGGTAGFYRVSYYLETTTGAGGAGTVSVSIAWTDSSGTSRTTTSAAVSLTATSNAQASGTVPVELASGNITYAVSHTGSYSTAKYALFITLEALA